MTCVVSRTFWLLFVGAWFVFGPAAARAENTLAAPPTPDLSWDARNPGGMSATEWAPAINTTGTPDADVTWNNTVGGGGTVGPFTSPRFPDLTAAYTFTSAQGATMPAGVWNTQIGFNASDEDATFEMWFRPSSFPVGGSPQYLHESGGSGDGIAFWLSGSTFNWTIDDGSNQETVFTDLSSIPGLDTSDLIQAVMVFDLTSGGSNNDRMDLYINGLPEATLTSTGTLEDFDGGGDTFLAELGAIPATAPAGVGFDGDIALFNYYRAALTADEVLAAFEAFPPPPEVPEPGTILLFGLALGSAGVWQVRARRRSEV